ncbi:MAG: CPBP family glutamic-type intramembrane protease [Planctomycetota bacterium]
MTKLLERVFPGMGFRPFWMTVLSAVCLVVYAHQGSTRRAPDWFLDLSREVTGVTALRFHQHLWGHVSALVVLMLVPLLAWMILERGRPTDLGLSARKAKREFLIVIGLWLAFLPVVWFMSDTPGFQRVYPRLREARGNLGLLIAYDGCYLLKWIAWEFFFRGFMLFGFKKDMGSRAVIVSTIPFVIMHFGKPQPEVYGSLAAGFILCWLALRSNSIWPGVLLHWLVATSMDVFAAF